MNHLFCKKDFFIKFQKYHLVLVSRIEEQICDHKELFV